MATLELMSKFDDADWRTFDAIMRSGKSEDEALAAMAERVANRK